MADTDKVAIKRYKTAIFTAIDIVMVFILTWVWFVLTHNWSEHTPHGVQSFWYTIYITAMFSLYYYAFEMSWHTIKDNMINNGLIQET